MPGTVELSPLEKLYTVLAISDELLEVFEKVNVPGIHKIDTFGEQSGAIGVGKVIFMHC